MRFSCYPMMENFFDSKEQCASLAEMGTVYTHFVNTIPRNMQYSTFSEIKLQSL